VEFPLEVGVPFVVGIMNPDLGANDIGQNFEEY
jgi:hypothetical protein